MTSYLPATDENTDHELDQLLEYSSLDELEEIRLRKAMLMSDMDKFKMFCRMMRIGQMLASAKITHK